MHSNASEFEERKQGGPSGPSGWQQAPTSLTLGRDEEYRVRDEARRRVEDMSACDGGLARPGVAEVDQLGRWAEAVTNLP